ncbi:hypothetical protein HF521_016847 [Silurus meridionalis]|uniref:Uncharacterized protein n=1 Tax=Silurus meridionalis TaxID=175797 RepID=A0A8T0BWY9_SILME|nr:hypothetical protein HF521_016847 [Silurus meridionalis]
MNSTDASSALEPHQTISSDGEQVCFQLQSQTPVLPNHHRRDVHSSSSTATGRRPLIILYRHRRDVHSSSSTATDRRPLIILYRHRQASTHHPLPPQAGVHSSSSTATDKMSTHRLLKPFETF